MQAHTTQTAAAQASSDGGFPPIGDYGAIGDCASAALVSRAGSVEWLTMPEFSRPSIFAAMLDRDRGGAFALNPCAPYETARRYLPQTNVLETTMRTEAGAVRILDFFPVADPEDRHKSLRPQQEMARIVEGLSGEVEMECRIAPRPNYGRGRVKWRRSGPHHRTLHWGRHAYMFGAEPDLALEDGALAGRFTVAEGQRARFSIGYTGGEPAAFSPLGAELDERLDQTLAWWRGWSDGHADEMAAPDMVRRSLLTLKLMIYSPSGAVVAAPTTSLPEAVGGVRNWDYRYCWLRDASLTMRALLAFGCMNEAESFMSWLLHSTHPNRPRLRVMYDVYGRTRMKERTLDHLSGYRGSRPVRVGNGARGQVQRDVEGEVALSAREYVRRGGRLDWLERRLLTGIGRRIAACWREPDHGMWEVRGDKRHYTHSKLMCWAGLDALIALGEEADAPDDLETLTAERHAIREAIEAEAWNPQIGAYAGVFGGTELDSAVLMMARLGFHPADHPRMVSTFEALDRQLGQGALMRRYSDGFDRLPPGEGAFVLVGFWAVDYLARRGDLEEARRRYDALIARCNDLGLLAEETDIETGAQLGNFPQAFSHVGLVTAAMTMAEMEQKGRAE